MFAIETKQLQKVYGATQVVKGIDLTVEKGKYLVFLAGTVPESLPLSIC